MDPPLYGADTSGSFFGANAGSWNVDQLDTLLQLVSSEGDLPGVTRSMLYFGTWKAMFAWHTEDLNLCSINYIHHGEPKSWYGVSPKNGHLMEKLAFEHFPEEFRKCKEFMRHKTTLFSPQKLKSANIPYTTCDQFENEFMITWPGAYHAGFNHGFNIAESSNFAIESWLKVGPNAKFCKCKPFSVRIDIGLLSYLYWRHHYLHGPNISYIHKNEDPYNLKVKNRSCKKPSCLAKCALEIIEEEKRYAPMNPKEAAKSRLESLKNGMPWAFCCLCGFSANSNSNLEKLVQKEKKLTRNDKQYDEKTCAIGETIRGMQFQCMRCEIWCHLMCVYENDKKLPKKLLCSQCIYITQRVDVSNRLIRKKSFEKDTKIKVFKGPYEIIDATITDVEDDFVLVQYQNENGLKEKEWLNSRSKKLLTYLQAIKTKSYFKKMKSEESKNQHSSLGETVESFNFVRRSRILVESSYVTQKWLSVLKEFLLKARSKATISTLLRKNLVCSVFEAHQISVDPFIWQYLEGILMVCKIAKERPNTWEYAIKCCERFVNAIDGNIDEKVIQFKSIKLSNTEMKNHIEKCGKKLSFIFDNCLSNKDVPLYAEAMAHMAILNNKLKRWITNPQPEVQEGRKRMRESI